MDPLSVLFYCFSLTLMAAAFLTLLRCSSLGIAVVVAEIPVVLGCMAYPLLLNWELVQPGSAGLAYLSRWGMPDIATALHVLAYALGAVLGVQIGIQTSSAGLSLVSTANQIARSQTSWISLVLIGIGLWLLFMSLTGWEVALSNAIFARAGELGGFGDSAKWLFVKSLASIFMFVGAAVPVWLVCAPRSGVAYMLFVVFMVLCFLNSYSRSAVLNYLLVPTLVAVFWSKRKSAIFGFFAVSIVGGGFLLLYAKSLGFVISNSLSGEGGAELAAYESDDAGLIEAYLRNVEYYWYSAAAGIENFSVTLLPHPISDVVSASTLGVLPSRVLEFVGLESWYYGTMPGRVACTNTSIFGLSEECIVPPQLIGFSAFQAPVVGGFMLSFISYWIYAYLVRAWREAERVDPKTVWLPFLLFLIAQAYFSLVLTVMAQTSLVSIVLLTAIAAVRHSASGRSIDQRKA